MTKNSIHGLIVMLLSLVLFVTTLFSVVLFTALQLPHWLIMSLFIVNSICVFILLDYGLKRFIDTKG